jgi:hypothetical protein
VAEETSTGEMTTAKKVVFITGATSGFGEAAARLCQSRLVAGAERTPSGALRRYRIRFRQMSPFTLLSWTFAIKTP